MPPQRIKSDLFAKLGDKGRRAFEEAKTKTTMPNVFGDLPGGIIGGVAQLVDCRFVKIKEGKQNAGEYMFFAAGVVKRPAIFNDMRIAGLRTQISEAMFDTPTKSRKTVQEHFDWVCTQLRGLGVKTEDLSVDNLEAACEALMQAKPHFRFRTSELPKATEGPYKDRPPTIYHQWMGYCEDPEEGHTEASGNGVVHDDTPEEPVDEVPEEGGGDDVDSTPTEWADSDDLDAIAEAAAGGDEGAQAALSTKGIEAGIDKEDVDNAPSWPELATMIREKQEAPEEEEKPFKVTDLAYYQPIDPKTKKKGRKIEVKILKIDAAKKTALVGEVGNLKKTYTAKLDDLTRD